MKNILLLREDITYNPYMIFHIGTLSTSNTSIKMIYNLEYLYRLESFLIENGYIFKWIEKGNILLGIEVTGASIDSDFLEYIKDCISFQKHIKYRIIEGV